MRVRPCRSPLAPRLAVVTLLIASASGLGCNLDRFGRLETGYRYRSLGDSEPERRAYYSDTYSDEALAAQREAQRDDGPEAFNTRGTR